SRSSAISSICCCVNSIGKITLTKKPFGISSGDSANLRFLLWHIPKLSPFFGHQENVKKISHNDD
ncbi:hypothetical protein ACWKSR_13190, partial [Campylobacter fetus subsp. venerealis]